MTRLEPDERDLAYCPECGGLWDKRENFCIECGFDGVYDDDEEYLPEPEDKWQPEYDDWLEGGEIRGDIEREDG